MDLLVSLLRRHPECVSLPVSGTGRTLLHHASSMVAERAVAELVARGADPNVRTGSGRTALHLVSGASSVGSLAAVEVCRELIHGGAKTNPQDNLGDTPLHLAVGRGCVELVRELLRNGALVSIRNGSGRTCFDVAAGHVADILREEARIAFSCKLTSCEPGGAVTVKVKKHGDVDKVQKEQISRLSIGKKMRLVLLYLGGGVGHGCTARHVLHSDEFDKIENIQSFLCNLLAIRGSHVTVKLATVLAQDPKPRCLLTVTSLAEAEVNLVISDTMDTNSEDSASILLREVRLRETAPRQVHGQAGYLDPTLAVLRSMASLRPYMLPRAQWDEGAPPDQPPFLEELVRTLFSRRQVIIRGPAGVGKTYLARCLGFAIAQASRSDAPPNLLATADIDGVLTRSGAVEVVAAHPGLTHAALLAGPVARICERARASKDLPFVLLIDNLTCVNATALFGELGYLLEFRHGSVAAPEPHACPHGYPAASAAAAPSSSGRSRSKGKHKVPQSSDLPSPFSSPSPSAGASGFAQPSSSAAGRLALPPNLLILCTAGTTPQARANLDASTRRRFAIVPITHDGVIRSFFTGNDPIGVLAGLGAVNERLKARALTTRVAPFVIASDLVASIHTVGPTKRLAWARRVWTTALQPAIEAMVEEETGKELDEREAKALEDAFVEIAGHSPEKPQ